MSAPILFHTLAIKSLDDQIEWMAFQLAQMKKHIPEGVRTGKITFEVGHDRIECAESVMNTLIGFRNGEARHG